MKTTEPSSNPIPYTNEQARCQPNMDTQVELMDTQSEPVAEDLGRNTATGSGEERPHKRTHLHFVVDP